MDPRLLAFPLGLPTVLTAGRYPLSDRGFSVIYAQHDSLALHLHDYHGRWRCDGVEHPLRPGTITISPLGVPNAYDLAAPGRHWCIHCQPACAAGLPTVPLPLIVQAGPEAAYARERMARIATLFDRARGHPAGGDGVAAAAGLLELMVWLSGIGQHAPHGDRGRAAAERAAALVRTHPEHTWTTGHLARRAGVSAAWLATGFRRHFGMTIARYVLVQRIERARVLLATSALPVAEIGILVGIPDPHHFNKRFRAIAGAAPSACRGRIDRPR